MTAADAISDLPRALGDFQPARGLIKKDYTDFVVEEKPLYAACGEGTHVYFLVEKAGLSTPQAVHDLAKAMNVRRRDIGYAGLKDSRAVTRQWMSLEHVDPAKLQSLEIPRLRVLEVTRHGNKLRLGHLVGNHFTIKVRQTELDRLADLQDALARLCALGAPNYFGAQRFGGRGDAWAVGGAIVRGEIQEALDLILGRPSERDHGDVRRARMLYTQEKFADAARAWPGMFRDERRALKALARGRGSHKRGFAAIDKVTRRFYVSAYQSHLFNRVVAERVEPGIDRLRDGDLALLHASGAVFAVHDASTEQPRADTFEISASGPLFGYRMTEPDGTPGERERQVLADEGLTPQAFRQGPLRVKGGRRAIRFRPKDATIRLGADERGAYLALVFSLPRGCYATTLLRELFRTEARWPATSPGSGEIGQEKTGVTAS